jgi:hypothetical protein
LYFWKLIKEQLWIYFVWTHITSLTQPLCIAVPGQWAVNEVMYLCFNYINPWLRDIGTCFCKIPYIPYTFYRNKCLCYGYRYFLFLWFWYLTLELFRPYGIFLCFSLYYTLMSSLLQCLSGLLEEHEIINTFT